MINKTQFTVSALLKKVCISIILLCCAVLAASATSLSQAPDYPLGPAFSIEHPDLRNQVVNDIEFDEFGRMWIGTESGLYIFDGHFVDKVTFNEKKRYSAYNNVGQINALSPRIMGLHTSNGYSFVETDTLKIIDLAGNYQDELAQKTLFSGIYDEHLILISHAGASAYSTVDFKRRWETYFHEHNAISYVTFMSDNAYVISVDGTLLKLRLKDGHVRTVLALAEEDKQQINDTRPISLHSDSYLGIAGNNGIKTRDTFTHQERLTSVPNCSSNETFPNSSRRGLWHVNENNEWLFINPCGLYRFDPKENQFDLLFAPTLSESAPFYATVNSNTLTQFNKWYRFNDGPQSYLLDSVSRAYRVPQEYRLQVGLSGRYHLTEDSGFSWFNTNSDKFIAHSNNISAFHGISESSLERLIGTTRLRKSLLLDDNSILIATQANGVWWLVRESEHNPWQTQGHWLDNEQVRALHQVGDDVYVGSESSGLHLLNLGTQKISKIQLNVQTRVFGFVNKSPNELLVYTFNAGVFVINLNTHQVDEHITEVNLEGVTYPLMNIRAVSKTASGEYWLGFHQAQTPPMKLDSNLNATELLANNAFQSYVFDIKELRNGALAIATWGQGLAMRSPDGDSLTFFTTQQGLGSDVVFGVYEVGDYLWVSTQSGLSQLTFIDNTLRLVKHFTIEDGLTTDSFDAEGHGITDDGTLVLSGNGGVVWFHPSSDIKHNNVPPSPAHWRDISIDGQKTLIAQSSLSYELPLDARNIELTFFAPSVVLHQKNQYRYRLNDSEWIALPSPRLSFPQLDSGRYTIDVAGSNNDGVWSEPANLSLQVLPAWYTSTLAWAIYIIITGLFVLTYIKIRTHTFALRSKALEQTVKERTQALELSLLEKENLFQDISHEFRTPLTLIMGKTEQLLEKDKSSELTSIHAQARRMHKLINNLLQLAEFGAIEKHPKTVYPFNKLMALILSFEHLATTKDITLARTTRISERASALLIEDTFELIVTNLLSNALKYSPNTSVISTILDYETSQLVFIIEDEGDGFDEMAMLTKRFVKGDKADVNDSSGLGLAIVDKAVAENNGVWEITNKPNKGCRIEVRLPCELTLETDVKPSISKDVTSVSTDTTADHKEYDALLVEDNSELAFFIQSIFPSAVNVRLATNGKEALGVLKTHSVDVIISDVMMPIMDGYELCKAVKSNAEHKHIPFILLTAKSDLPSQMKGLNLGANDYIGKPFSADALLARISNAISHMRSVQKHNRHLLVSLDTSPSQKTDSFEVKAISILSSHFADSQFQAKAMADELFVSEKTLSRRLKSHFGMTFSKFLNDYRLAIAKSRLEHGEPIKQVISDCGFSSQSYFTERFKKRYGKTPSAYVK